MVLDNANEDKKLNPPRAISKITCGKKIVDIQRDVSAYQFHHDVIESNEEAEYVSKFLQNIQDWGEVSGFDNFEIDNQIQLRFELNKDFKELEIRGFLHVEKENVLV